MESLKARAAVRTGPRRYLLFSLIFVELLMSFSFLGYFHLEPISVTTAYLPVLLAGALATPVDATIVGAVFGLASLWKASASYVMAADQLFSPLFSGDPLGSLMLSVGSRTLFGLTVGLLFLAARHLPCPRLGVAAVSFLGQTVHSLMVYSAMALFFPEAGFGPADAFDGCLEPAKLLSNAAIAAMVLVLWQIGHSQVWLRFWQRMELTEALTAGERHHYRLPLAIVVAATAACALAVTFYFVHRIDYVLEISGIELTETSYADVFHLQLQFLFGIISLMLLVAMFLVLARRFALHIAQGGRLDPLTGAMTRRAFFAACAQALRALKGQACPSAYFLMVDLDRFKEINDTYGHPEGDRALREVARGLREIFPRESVIGRMGGDEFALLVCADLSEAELEVLLRHFLSQVRKTAWGERQLTCSIGALRVSGQRPPEELYLEADRLLYTAKERGRDQFVLGTEPSAPPPDARR